MRDRGFMVLFGGLCAAVYVLFAFTPVLTYQSLLVAYLLLGTSFLFVSSAQNGLTSAIGQQHVMTGQVSAAWNIFGSLDRPPLKWSTLSYGFCSRGGPDAEEDLQAGRD